MVSSVNLHHRIRILGGLCFLMIAIFIVRLFVMQILQNNLYVGLANQDQIKSLILPATRGEIYAMDKDSPVKLVLNETVYTAYVNPMEVTNPSGVVSAIQEIAGGTAVKGIDKLVRDKPYQYRVVARNVTRQQAEMLKAKNLKGLGFQRTSQRVYPENTLAAQVLGFVNANGQGQYGVEGALNDELKGKDGLLRSVTDVSGIPLSIGSHNIEKPAQDGKNVVLTIDRNIQSFTESALAKQLDKIGATNGSVIVMDPQSGKVLAMANIPTYSPEKYYDVTDASVFNNATISAPYEPGSVIKTYTLATGIDKGVVSPSSTYNNTDYIKVDDVTITNAHKGITGQITMQTALNNSLNTGMVTVAERLGDGQNINLNARNTMYDYFHNRFGLGTPTGIELAGESGGEVISPEQPDGNAVRYSNMSFGQGMDITMVQVAAGFCSIINGGQYYKPTIIAGSVDDNGIYDPNAAPKPLRQTISPATSATVKQMVHDARAAFFKDIDKPGYDVGGKTGTSQTLVNGKYVDNQTVATYLGYGGDTKPRYVIMVQVSGAGKNFQGNFDAMPVFTDISNWMIDYMQLQPKG